MTDEQLYFKYEKMIVSIAKEVAESFTALTMTNTV